MNKNEYLQELSSHLKKLSKSEIDDILSDYREHFEMGIRAGKSESEIADSLGHPRAVAQEYLVTNLIQKADTSTTAIGRMGVFWQILLVVIILAPFNFIFLIGPFVIALVFIVTGWAIPIAIAGVSIAIFGAFLSSASVAPIGVLSGISLLCLFLGVLGLSGILGTIMVAISRLFSKFLIAYTRWNINFIKIKKA